MPWAIDRIRRNMGLPRATSSNFELDPIRFQLQTAAILPDYLEPFLHNCYLTTPGTVRELMDPQILQEMNHLPTRMVVQCDPEDSSRHITMDMNHLREMLDQDPRETKAEKAKRKLTVAYYLLSHRRTLP